MNNVTLYLDAPNVGEKEKEYLGRCIDSTYVSTYGPFVGEFESGFAEKLGVQRAISVQSGTAGLHIVLSELGIGPGDEVIVPVLTFAATVNPVAMVGAKPVFVDVEKDTWNIDPIKVEEAVTNRTKAIIPVHLYGNPCRMDRLLEIAERHGLYVIEDATESLFSQYEGEYTGTMGHFGVFSFNGNKLMTTGGGGMVVGRNDEQLEHIRYLINQARDYERSYYHSEIGCNYRMTNIEASLGLAQLQRVDDFVKSKTASNKIYSDILAASPRIALQRAYEKADVVWWLTSIVISDDARHDAAASLQMKLSEYGIPSRRIFMPIVEFPPYRDKDRSKFKNAYSIYDSGLNLPSSTLNRVGDVRWAADKILMEVGGC